MKRHCRQCISAITHPDYATLVGPLFAAHKEGGEGFYIFNAISLFPYSLLTKPCSNFYILAAYGSSYPI
jgi:hypothetical protein